MPWTCNVRIESLVCMGETFWRYSTVLGVYEYMEGKGGGIKSDLNTYPEQHKIVKLRTDRAF